MSQLGISYTSSGGTSYNFVLDNFGDNAYPRSYESSADFSSSANGASILTGPAYVQKYQWVIATVMQPGDAVDFEAMFRAWDADRAQGKPVACGITDNTFGPQVDTNAVFVTPPSFTRMGPGFTMVAVGLAEV